MQTHAIYFSPGGTTKTIIQNCSAFFDSHFTTLNLLQNNCSNQQYFSEQDLCIIGLPVFAGRLPAICVNQLRQLHGKNTPVIAVVVYGNRAYEDALLELTDLLQEQGFCVFGAAACIARHSIFTQIAADRPDDSDKTLLNDFFQKCHLKLQQNLHTVPLKTIIPGNRPYKAINVLPLVPTGDNTCINCGRCSSICPVKAITPTAPQLTDAQKCITCTACIHICPVNSRRFHNPDFPEKAQFFAATFKERQEPEFFI